MKISRNQLKEMILKVLNEEENSEYQDFFKTSAEKFGFNPDEIDELPDDKKKKFFSYIENNWKSKNESLNKKNRISKVKKITENQLRQLIKRLVKEELSFLTYSDEKDGHIASRKVQKKRKRLGVGV